MQLTIFIAPDLVNDLRQLASQDCRTIHQEAKWLLSRAIEQAAKEQDRAQALDAQEKDYATAP